MKSFNIFNGNSTTFTDTTPGTGVVINFASLDNSFSVQINGVDLFVSDRDFAPNELEFQWNGPTGQTVRFEDGDMYRLNTAPIWELGNTNGEPVVRLEINPDGTIALSGVKVANGPLEPLELINGMTVNTAAIEAAWNDSGPNTIVVDQFISGPTQASGDIGDIPCFCGGTLITTIEGPKPVEDLRAGDMLLTADEGYRPIRMVLSQSIDADRLKANPKFFPVRIAKGALGNELPQRDLWVSRQHRMLISSMIVNRMLGRSEALVSAIRLTTLPGIEEDATVDRVDYYHLIMDKHQVLFAENAPTESFMLGKMAPGLLTYDSLDELVSIFGLSRLKSYPSNPIRIIPELPQQKRLVERHLLNNTPILALHKNIARTCRESWS